MPIPTTISYKPTFKIFPSFSSKLKFFKLKPFSYPKIPSSNLVFSTGFISQNPIFRWHTMTELMRINAYSSGDGDEGLEVFETDAFINGSPSFREKCMDGGLEATLNRLSKWLVAALFGAVILGRHDAEAMWAAMGSVGNAGLSKVLKKILNQERPFSTLRSDPGMPSSHAQSIFFIVMFAIISMVEWQGVNELTLTLSGFVGAFGIYLSWLRVSQNLHTVSQVLVGAVVGSMFSALWFWLWNAIVLKAFISSLWVRVLVILGAAGFCIGFLVYVVRYWLIDDER